MIDDLFYYFVLDRKVLININFSFDIERYYIVFIFDADKYHTFDITEMSGSVLTDLEKVVINGFPNCAYQIIKTDSEKIKKIEHYIKDKFKLMRDINVSTLTIIRMVLLDMNNLFFNKYLPINF